MRHGKRNQPLRDRRVGTRSVRAHVLIVCEDDKAEPNYLCGLCREHRLTNAVVIEGGAGDPTNLLTVAQGKEFQDFDTVWCVFDRDSWPADDFDNAVRRCTGRLRGAWSNEAFELWYVLHFDYLNTATAGHGGRVRDHYQNRLKALLGDYQKNALDMWDRLRPQYETACRNARKLQREHDASTPPHARCPVTHVVDLVEALVASGG